MTEPVFEVRPPGPPEPVTWERIAAFYDEIEAAKRILACAPDVYEQVKSAVEASTVAGLFEVVENRWLDDGQVLSIDPAVFELPPPEAAIDLEAFKPHYRCVSCSKPVYTLGHCTWCEVFATTYRPPFAPGAITGLGT
jgi:hypothetical protein